VSYTDQSRVLTVALGGFRALAPGTRPDWSGLVAATLVAAARVLIPFALFAEKIANALGFSGSKSGAHEDRPDQSCTPPPPRPHRAHPRHPGLTRRRLLRGSAAVAAGAVGAGALSACGQSAAPAGATEIDYWLWDANQLPAYSAAIDLFMEQNPDIFVRITQLGWDDYWTKLTASFVAEAGPDAFADHLARFPEFVNLGVIAPLDDLAPLADITADRFQEGLQELWSDQE